MNVKRLALALAAGALLLLAAAPPAAAKGGIRIHPRVGISLGHSWGYNSWGYNSWGGYPYYSVGTARAGATPPSIRTTTTGTAPSISTSSPSAPRSGSTAA